jgi:hypothetical protein
VDTNFEENVSFFDELFKEIVGGFLRIFKSSFSSTSNLVFNEKRKIILSKMKKMNN